MSTEELIAQIDRPLIASQSKKIKELQEELRFLSSAAADAYWSGNFGEADLVADMIKDVRKELKELGVET